MTRLIIVRHGETEYNLKGLCQGQLDSKLTQRGKLQAECVSNREDIKRIDAVYSSPLRRALNTAQIINKKHNLEIIIEDGLKEINCGEWEGLWIEAIKSEDAQQYHNWANEPMKYKVDGAETFEQVYNRATESLNKIIKEYKGKTVLIVSHLVTISLILAYLFDEDIDSIWKSTKQKNASVNIIDIKECGKKEFVVRGDDSHLTREALSASEW